MKRRALGTACLIGVAFAAAAMAQAADDAVLLRYQFKPGEEFRYRMTMSGDMGTTIGGMTPPAGAALPGKIPSTVSGTYELVEKVTSVSPEGVAAVSVAMDKMDTTTSVIGMNVVVRLGAGGKVETLMNGQPMPLPNMPNTTLPNPLYEIKIDPSGKVTPTTPSPSSAMSRLFGGQNISAMFNSDLPGIGMLMLPEKPVKPGDTWDTQREVHVPLAMPGMAGGGPGGAAPGTPFTLKTSIHNKLARIEDGHAVIETQVTATAPPGARVPLPGGGAAPSGASMTIQKMDQSMTGTQRFNVEQGFIEGGDNEMKIAIVMAMGLPAGLPGAGPGVKLGANTKAAPGKKPAAATVADAPAGAPRSLMISVDGTIKMKIARLVTPPAAGAAPSGAAGCDARFGQPSAPRV